MRKSWYCKNIHMDPNVAISVALSQYHFSTPEIRILMRNVLGHALSGRTIKRVVRSAGRRLKRGRPRTTPRVHKKCVNDLIGATSQGLGVFDSNALHFLNHIEVQFGLSPRQYFKWITQFVRRGKYMMRKCLLCGEPFPSLRSGDRHCQHCKSKREHLIRHKSNSIFEGFSEIE
jgi:hypothetical protein